MYLFRSLLVLVTLTFVPAQAQETVLYGSLTQSEQISVIQTLIENGEFEQAQTLLAGSVFDEGDTGYQAAYFQAIIFRIQGDYEQAEMILRQVLSDRPEFRLVRLELAQVLIAQGRREGASYQFGILSDTAASLEEAEEFDRLIDNLDPGTGFEPSFFVTFAPSSNFNNGATSRTVLIGGLPFQISNTAQSGMGVRYGGSLTYTHAMSENVQLFAGVNAQEDNYPDNTFDTQTGGVRFGLNLGPERDRITTELFANRRWVNDAVFDEGYGIRFSLRRPISASLSLEGSLAIERRDLVSGTDTIRRTLTGGVTRAFNARSGIRFGARLDEQQSPTFNLDYNSFTPSVGAYYGFDNGLVFDASYEFENRNYALQILGTTREDDISRFRLAARWDKLRIFDSVPVLAFILTDNDSTLVPFEYEARTVELTFSQAF